jgi:hypothetical protein
MILAALLLSVGSAARTNAGGYFRVMTRPDLQGGDGRLGYWNLYGRLLNEGPYAALDFKFDMLEREPGGAPWTSIHARIEGASIGNSDSGNGALGMLRLSQVYVQSGNLLMPGLTWQFGTLDSYFGDLGLYDMRPTQLFLDTVGLSARYQTSHFELLIGGGDAGYAIRDKDYNTIFSGGGSIRYRPIDQLEAGLGGQARYEPSVQGNRTAPYYTEGVEYEDFVRAEVVQSFLEDNPFQEVEFPDPKPTNASSAKAVGYLGFGGFGRVIWNNLYASFERLHPEGPVAESHGEEDYGVYTTRLTDERRVLMVGNELQLTVLPGRVDAAWAMLYASHWDKDNDILPTDHDRVYYSTVLRTQVYLTPYIHLLFESSFAQEESRNGNMFREHTDSIFSNTAGVSDSRGLEYGDTSRRSTWQGKGGLVLNPMGKGIFTRPSMRILYGAQHSNQNNAFGNRFVESLDQYNEFGNVEQHWHHLIALETEAWF